MAEENKAQEQQEEVKASKKKQSKTPSEKKEFKPGIPHIKAVKSGVQVEFTKSPTGLFGLAYNPGEKASFTKDQAEILIDAGVAKKA